MKEAATARAAAWGCEAARAGERAAVDLDLAEVGGTALGPVAAWGSASRDGTGVAVTGRGEAGQLASEGVVAQVMIAGAKASGDSGRVEHAMVEALVDSAAAQAAVAVAVADAAGADATVAAALVQAKLAERAVGSSCHQDSRHPPGSTRVGSTCCRSTSPSYCIGSLPADSPCSHRRPSRHSPSTRWAHYRMECMVAKEVRAGVLVRAPAVKVEMGMAAGEGAGEGEGQKMGAIG